MIAVSRIKAAKRREKALMREYRRRTSNDDNSGPTALTKAHQVKSSFARLCDNREIDGAMYQAASEIDRVYMALCGGLMAGSSSAEPKSRSMAAAMPESVATAHAKRYLPWAVEMARRRNGGGPPAVEIVIDVVVDMRSLDTIDRERRWRNGTAKRVLRLALLEYAVMAGWVPSSELSRVAA